MGGLLAAVTTGLLLGGAAGGIVGAQAASTPTVSALVELVATPDPALSDAPESGAAAAEAADQFAAISSEGFGRAVSERVGDVEGPPVKVTRVGQSTVAEFSARARSEAEGTRIVQAAVDLYLENRTTAARAALEQTAASLDTTIKDLQAQAGDGAPRTRGTDPLLQSRIDRLLTLQAGVDVALNRTGPPVQVVQPVTTTRRPS